MFRRRARVCTPEIIVLIDFPFLISLFSVSFLYLVFHCTGSFIFFFVSLLALSCCVCVVCVLVARISASTSFFQPTSLRICSSRHSRRESARGMRCAARPEKRNRKKRWLVKRVRVCVGFFFFQAVSTSQKKRFCFYLEAEFKLRSGRFFFLSDVMAIVECRCACFPSSVCRIFCGKVRKDGGYCEKKAVSNRV